MRAWLLMMLVGCVGEAPGYQKTPACETATGPIRVLTTGSSDPDVVAFHDANGRELDTTQPRDGVAQLDQGPCDVDVTLVTSAYGARTAFTVTDVHPGDLVSFTQATAPGAAHAFSIAFPQMTNAFYSFRAPGCTASQTSTTLAAGLCFTDEQVTVLALANELGTGVPLGFAVVELTQDATGALSATIPSWRTDFATTNVTATNAPAGTTVKTDVGQFGGGRPYANAKAELPAMFNVPKFGDQIIDTTAEADERFDEVLDMFATLPAEHAVDLGAEMPIRIQSQQSDGAVNPTIEWVGNTSTADAVFACAEWPADAGSFAAWCMLVDPAQGNTATFPKLPTELAPLTPPMRTSVTAIDTSATASFNDVRSQPFAVPYVPGQNVPTSFRLRASRQGPLSPFTLLR